MGDQDREDAGADTRWLSYEEAADALGWKVASIRRKATRARWPRMVGNDGQARVAVPVKMLERHPRGTGGAAPPPAPPAAPGEAPPGNAPETMLHEVADRFAAAMGDQALQAALADARDARAAVHAAELRAVAAEARFAALEDALRRADEVRREAAAHAGEAIEAARREAEAARAKLGAAEAQAGELRDVLVRTEVARREAEGRASAAGAAAASLRVELAVARRRWWRWW